MPKRRGQGSFFERLDPDAVPLRVASHQDRISDCVRAIKQHLQWILNTRQGCCNSNPELGLRDFNDASMDSTDLPLRISEDIRSLIAAFEPRVRVLSVRKQPSPSQPSDLHFRVLCRLMLDGKDDQVEIDLVVNDRSTRVAN